MTVDEELTAEERVVARRLEKLAYSEEHKRVPCLKCGQPMQRGKSVCSYCDNGMAKYGLESSLRRRKRIIVTERLRRAATLKMSPEEILSQVGVENIKPLERPLFEVLKHERYRVKTLTSKPTAPFEPTPRPTMAEVKVAERSYDELHPKVQHRSNKKNILVVRRVRQMTSLTGLLVFNTDDGGYVGVELDVWQDEGAKESVRRIFGQGVVVGSDGAGRASEGQCLVGSGVELQRRDSEDPVRSGDGGRCVVEARSVDGAGDEVASSSGESGDHQD
jgi:predicted amidophosphoribosyltransferase